MSLAKTQQTELTAGHVNYYLIEVPEPKRLAPYTVEVEDLIHALDMRFDEGNTFKALVRICKLRMDLGKPGSSFQYEAEKIIYYGAMIMKRIVGKEKLVAYLDKLLSGLRPDVCEACHDG